MKRITFIINPISGTRAKKDIASYIEKELDTTIYAPTFVTTQYAGHAHELAMQAAAEGVAVVVAVGGDGTVNEVASALVHTPTALGIIPCGSGNGLARHQRIPMKVKGAVDVLNHGVVRALDYGTINGRAFFCTCGVGFDAFVSMKFAEGGKRGFLSYIEKTLREGVRYKSETYTLKYDGQDEEQEAFLIACANASQYGNNAYIAPEASMEDGLMDVIILKPFYTIQAPQVIMQLFNKSLPHNPHVQVKRLSHLQIHRPSSGGVHIDGDPIMMGQDIDVKIHHGQFNMLVSPQPAAVGGHKNPLRTLADICTDILGI